MLLGYNNNNNNIIIIKDFSFVECNLFRTGIQIRRISDAMLIGKEYYLQTILKHASINIHVFKFTFFFFVMQCS